MLRFSWVCLVFCTVLVVVRALNAEDAPQNSKAQSLRLQARTAIVDQQLELAGRAVSDDFAGPNLSGDWTLRFDGTATGWKTELRGSKLLVTDIEGKAGYAIARLTRPVALPGEFKLALKFEWTSKDSGADSNRAMQVLLLNLRDANGDIVMSHGYVDENNTNRGSPVGGIHIGPDLLAFQLKQYNQAATPSEFANSLSADGAVDLTIARDAQGLLTGTFDGGGQKQVLRGIHPGTVAEIELEFRRYVLDGATFEGLAIDQLSVTGKSALQDPATATAIRTALLKEERERTAADKTLLATRGPRTLLTEADIQRLLQLKQPTLKNQLDKASEARIQTARGAPQLKPAGKPVFPGPVLDFAVSPDGKKLATCGMFEAIIIDAATGTMEKVPFPDPETNRSEKQLNAIRYTPTGKLATRLFSRAPGQATLDSLVVQDLTTRKQQIVPVTAHSYHISFEVLPDENYLFSTASFGHVQILHQERGYIGGFFLAHGTSNDVAVSRDGKLAAVGYDGGRLILFHIPPPERLAVASIEDRADLKRIVELKRHTTDVLNVEFSPDGKTLSSADLSGTVWLWDIETQRAFVGVDGTFATFSPDSKLVATVDATGKKLGPVAAVWNATTGKALHVLSGGHDHPLIRVRFNKSGNQLYTTEGKQIQVWKLPAKK